MSLMLILTIWGFVSIAICAGEEIPGEPIDDTVFIISKLIGIVSLTTCYATWRILGKKGWLPKFNEED